MTASRTASRIFLLATLLGGLLAVQLFGTTRARAAGSQVAILEDDAGLLHDTVGTLTQMRLLGVQVARVPVRWMAVAPAANSHRKPSGFNAADSGARGYSWGPYDAIAQAAAQSGMKVNFDVTGGAPLWATGPGNKGTDAGSRSVWEPSAREFAAFVKAAGTRYSGSYTPPGASSPLPRVTFWSIWNEPDYGPSLAPQGLPSNLKIDYAPQQYRNLVNAAWSSLHATGHGSDTILFGELAPRGYDYWGLYSGMRPLFFLRSLYCVDSRYRPLQGRAAKLRGCPTNAAGSHRFRSENPALFQASGFADHPYMRWYPPNKEQNPDPVTHEGIADYSTLGTMAAFERGLDRLQRVYGSSRHLPIYDTEFAYITSPPKRRWSGDKYPWVSQTTAADYLNWAEYIHWRDPRILAYMQYLLRDPLPALRSNDYGGFASGLLAYDGRPKPTYSAWRLPLYMPVTHARRGSRLEVWGCARPTHYAVAEGAGPQIVHIQVAPGANPSNSQFQDVAIATITNQDDCYFDQRVAFASAGLQSVRITWQYPAADPLGYFDPLHAGGMAYSRHVLIRLS